MLKGHFMKTFHLRILLYRQRARESMLPYAGSLAKSLLQPEARNFTGFLYVGAGTQFLSCRLLSPGWTSAWSHNQNSRTQSQALWLSCRFSNGVLIPSWNTSQGHFPSTGFLLTDLNSRHFTRSHFKSSLISHNILCEEVMTIAT